MSERTTRERPLRRTRSIGCIISVALSSLVCEAQPVVAGKVTAADLVGEWAVQEDDTSCMTQSFRVQLSGTQLHAVEMMRCGPNLWLLNFYGELFEQNERFLLSFNPPVPGSGVKAAELIEP